MTYWTPIEKIENLLYETCFKSCNVKQFISFKREVWHNTTHQMYIYIYIYIYIYTTGRIIYTFYIFLQTLRKCQPAGGTDTALIRRIFWLLFDSSICTQLTHLTHPSPKFYRRPQSAKLGLSCRPHSQSSSFQNGTTYLKSRLFGAPMIFWSPQISCRPIGRSPTLGSTWYTIPPLTSWKTDWVNYWNHQ